MEFVNLYQAWQTTSTLFSPSELVHHFVYQMYLANWNQKKGNLQVVHLIFHHNFHHQCVGSQQLASMSLALPKKKWIIFKPSIFHGAFALPLPETNSIAPENRRFPKGNDRMCQPSIFRYTVQAVSFREGSFRDGTSIPVIWDQQVQPGFPIHGMPKDCWVWRLPTPRGDLPATWKKQVDRPTREITKGTLPETKSQETSLKIGRPKKERIVFQPSIFRCKLLVYSFLQ